MTDKLATIPPGYTTVTPWIISRNTDAVIEFAKSAFDAEELGEPVRDAEGRIGHAEFRIGNAVVMAFDAADHWADTPAFLRLYVEDADDTLRRAVAAGGTLVTKATHLIWGDRVGRVRDPLGNIWWIQSRVEEVDEEEMNRRLTDPEFLAAMEYVQSTDFMPRRPA
jgi:PhnB protein